METPALCTRIKKSMGLMDLMEEQIEHMIEQFFTKSYLTQDLNLQQDIYLFSLKIINTPVLLILGEKGLEQEKFARHFYQIKSLRKNRDQFPFIKIHLESLSGVNFHVKWQEILDLTDGATVYIEGLEKIDQDHFNQFKKLLNLVKNVQEENIKKIFLIFSLETDKDHHLTYYLKNNLYLADLFQLLHSSLLILMIPSLKERKDDILTIIKHQTGLNLSQDLEEKILDYSWPRNRVELNDFIFYLQNLKKTVATLETSLIVQVNHLPASLFPHFSSSSGDLDEKLLTKQQLNYLKKRGIKEFLEHMELEAIKTVMNEAHGSAHDSIKILQIPKASFYRIWNKVSKKN